MVTSFSVYGLETIPEISPGDNLAEIIFSAAAYEEVNLQQGDIVVISSKVISKSQGRIIVLPQINPSRKAQAIARLTGKDPARVEFILRESRGILGYISTKKLEKTKNLCSVFSVKRRQQSRGFIVDKDA